MGTLWPVKPSHGAGYVARIDQTVSGPDSSFHHTRRVVLPTYCCHVEQRRSGDLRKFAYEFWMLTQYTDQNSCLVIGL